MKYLITAYAKVCTDCAGVGHRQQFDEGPEKLCPVCNGQQRNGAGESLMPVAHLVDGVVHRLWPGVPYEVENHFVAENIVLHQTVRGVVEVRQHFTGRSLDLDVDAALERSEQVIRQNYQRLSDEYIRHQLEFFIPANRPPICPTGLYAEAITTLGINLDTYGIRPPGWRTPASVREKEAKVADLEVTNQSQQEQISRLTGMVEQLNRQVQTLAGTSAETEQPVAVPAGGGNSTPPKVKTTKKTK